MQKIFYTILASLISVFSLQANTIFEKSYGNQNCYEEGFSVVEIEDGQFLLSAGYNCTGNPTDWTSYQLFLDKNGDINASYAKTPYNGLITKTSDNHILYAGGERAGMNYDSVRIFKTDLSGNIIWEKALQFAACKNNVWDIQVNDADEILISGTYPFTNCNSPLYNSFVTKLDSDGNKIWTQKITGDFNDQLYSVRHTPEGGAVAFGWTNSIGSSEQRALLVKIDSLGNLEWEKTYIDEQSTFPMTYGYGLKVTDNNEYLMIGYSSQIYVFKTDANGHLIWENRFGNACGGIYFKALQTKDGGYAFLANKSTGSGCRSTLFKTHNNGELAWEKIWDARLKDVHENMDGSFILTGYIDHLPKIHVVHFDTIRFIKKAEIEKENNLADKGELKTDEETKDTPTFSSHSDLKHQTQPTAFFPKAAIDEVVSSTFEKDASAAAGLNVYPVPANDFVTFSLKNSVDRISAIVIYDSYGRVVRKKTMLSAHEISIERNTLPAGNYFFNLTTEKGKIETGVVSYR